MRRRLADPLRRIQYDFADSIVVVALALRARRYLDFEILENETIQDADADAVQTRCIATVLLFETSDQDANCPSALLLAARDARNLDRSSSIGPSCLAALIISVFSWSSSDFPGVVASERLLGQREGRSIRFWRLNVTLRLHLRSPFLGARDCRLLHISHSYFRAVYCFGFMFSFSPSISTSFSSSEVCLGMSSRQARYGVHRYTSGPAGCSR